MAKAVSMTLWLVLVVLPLAENLPSFHCLLTLTALRLHYRANLATQLKQVGAFV